jgi:hypothetical protein
LGEWVEIKKPIVYRGAKEICNAVGVNWKEMSHFVDAKELPAFKIDGKGTWIALHEDLLAWIKQQRSENLKKPN